MKLLNELQSMVHRPAPSATQTTGWDHDFASQLHFLKAAGHLSTPNPSNETTQLLIEVTGLQLPRCLIPLVPSFFEDGLDSLDKLTNQQAMRSGSWFNQETSSTWNLNQENNVNINLIINPPKHMYSSPPIVYLFVSEWYLFVPPFFTSLLFRGSATLKCWHRSNLRRCLAWSRTTPNEVVPLSNPSHGDSRPCQVEAQVDASWQEIP